MSKHSKGRVLRWLHGEQGVPWGADPDDYDPGSVAVSLGSLGSLFGEEGGPRRYFPVESSGWEHVPPAPAMVVSNHSAGATVLDTMGFLIAWYRRFGVHRPIHPLAHEVILSTRVVGSYVAARGVLRASRELARHTL